MNDSLSPFQPPNEEALLHQIERMEAGRDMYLQLLRENPEIIKFQDVRTLQNFGITGQESGRSRTGIAGVRAAWRLSGEFNRALEGVLRLLHKIG